MSNSIPNQFRVALNRLLGQEGRGAQVRLSIAQNIDRGYLNAIIKGRKPGAEDIRARIATHFGMTYEEMLTLGRSIQEGKNVAEEEPVVPASLKSSEVKAVVENNKPQGEGDCGSKISEKVLKVMEILESGTEYSDLLSRIIDTYHKSIATSRANQALDLQLKAIEERLGRLEGMLLKKKVKGSRK